MVSSLLTEATHWSGDVRCIHRNCPEDGSPSSLGEEPEDRLRAGDEENLSDDGEPSNSSCPPPGQCDA